MRPLDLVERQLRTDERTQAAGVPQAEQLANGGSDELGIESQQPSEVEAVEPDVAADEARRLDLRPRAGRRADRDDRTERAQPRERAGEELAADRIDDDVHLQVLGQVGVDVGLLRAELTADVELLRRSDRGNDASAECAGDLDRRRADTAGARVDEHDRPGPHAHLARERDVRREEGEQERGALGEARVVG